MSEFCDWAKDFERSRAGRRALGELKKIESIRQEHFDNLRYVVLKACYDATCFVSESDPFRVQRKADTKRKKETSSQLSAINKLRNFIKKHPAPAGNAMAIGYQLEKRKRNDHFWLRPADESTRKYSELLDELLAAYAEGLQKPHLFHGVLLHRKRYGNLSYPKPIRSALPTVESMLLFQLVFYFRNWTAKKEMPFRYMSSERMPKCGSPHYVIAWHYVTAALFNRPPNPDETRENCDLIRKRLDQLLKSRPGLVSWPDQPPGTFDG